MRYQLIIPLVLLMSTLTGTSCAEPDAPSAKVPPAVGLSEAEQGADPTPPEITKQFDRLLSTDAESRAMAEKELAAMGQPACWAILRRLASDVPADSLLVITMRRWIGVSGASSGDPSRSTPKLLDVIEGTASNDARVRCGSLRFLTMVRDLGPDRMKVAQLAGKLAEQDADKGVRKAAYELREAQIPVAIATFESSDAKTRAEAIEWISLLGANATNMAIAPAVGISSAVR